jgi:multicomponent Na+:H+ antiporter subunit D
VAKLSLVRAGLEVEQYLLVGIALGVSLLTLFSMLRLWGEAFWKPAPRSSRVKKAVDEDMRNWLWPIVVLAAITVLIGLGAGPIFGYALQAGQQLMNPALYIQAVMGGTP